MSEFSESLSLVGVVYALAFVIAMGAALLIKLIVGALAFNERHAEAKAAAASAAAAPAARPVAAEGIPAHHLVAIAAAAHAMVGAHRILHIGAAASGRYWSTEGRLAQHNAHHPH